MMNGFRIFLNIFWNMTGLSLVFFILMAPIDLLYIIYKQGALDRYNLRAYFAPFGEEFHREKRFLETANSRRVKKEITEAQTNYSKQSPSTMTGFEFEVLIYGLLVNNGYKKVSRTLSGSCFGADITAQIPVGSSYENICVKCLRVVNSIPDIVIQEVYDARKYYKCERAMVVTDSTFTPEAIRLAQKYGVILWDKDTLDNLLNHPEPSDHHSKKRYIDDQNYSTKVSDDDEDYDDEDDEDEDDDALTYEEIDDFDLFDGE